MKQIRFLGTLLVCFALFASTDSVAQIGKKKLIIQNRAVVDAYCAYVYLIDKEDAAKIEDYVGYHVRGWVHIPSGRAKTIDYASNYSLLYHCIILTDGRKWEKEDIPTFSFDVSSEFTESSFQVVYELLPDLRLGDRRYSSVKNKLTSRVFYKEDLGETGRSVTVVVPGPVDIQEEKPPPPPSEPSDQGTGLSTSSNLQRFDGHYTTTEYEGQRTDYALLFATNKYEYEGKDKYWANLETPIKDAEAIGAELADRYGFQVRIERNLETREDIRNVIQEYAGREYKDGDQLFIYFAGHGTFKTLNEETGDGVGYIAVGHSESPKKDPAHNSYLSYGDLRDDLDAMACDRIMLVLDVCQSGTFDKDIALTPETVEPEGPQTRGHQRTLQLKDTLAVRTRWYLSSGGKEDVYDGEELGNSPFALAFLRTLRGEGDDLVDDVLTLPEIERQLPRHFQMELANLAKLYGGMELKQKPASGPFDNNPPDKAFVFIKKAIDSTM